MIRHNLFFVFLVFALVLVPFLVMRLALQACDINPAALGFFMGACPDHIETSRDDIAIALAERRSLEAHMAQLQRLLLQQECPVALPPSRAEAPKAIDPKAWEERDVSLLEGCWELDSDLSFIDRVTQELRDAAAWKMCFDAAGNGSQTLSLVGEVVCTSDRVSAAFDAKGELVVRDNADLQCSDNTYIYERIITCTLADDGTAACLSRQPETGSRSSLSLRR